MVTGVSGFSVVLAGVSGVLDGFVGVSGCLVVEGVVEVSVFFVAAGLVVVVSVFFEVLDGVFLNAFAISPNADFNCLSNGFNFAIVLANFENNFEIVATVFAIYAVAWTATNGVAKPTENTNSAAHTARRPTVWATKSRTVSRTAATIPPAIRIAEAAAVAAVLAAVSRFVVLEAADL